MRNEQCWVLMGKRRGSRFWMGKYDRYTEGQPASVVFDNDYVWENRDKIVGWIHTHPSWTANPSSIDNATMKAQVGAIGKPMVCVIQGTDGIRAWWYFDDESPAVEGKVTRMGKRLFGRVPKFLPQVVYMKKALDTGEKEWKEDIDEEIVDKILSRYED